MSLTRHLNPHVFTSHRDGTKRYFAHHDMPYPIDCALLGHKPVWVALPTLGDGHGYHECSRCTLRPNLSEMAQMWTGVGGDLGATPRQFMERALSEGEVYWRPRRAESHLEIAGRYVDRFEVYVKIGNAGSETPLDAHLIIPGWRGFYFGTSVLGARIAHWRSRRAPAGRRYESRAWRFCIDRRGVHLNRRAS